MGHVFVGYKGGDYIMSYDTPIWISYEGTYSGDKLTDLDLSKDIIVPTISDEDE